MTTIGVSVAVPPPWGPELQAYRVALGDPAAAGIPAHITLLPPVDVDDIALADVVKHLREAAADVPPFEVLLRGTDCFRPVSPVVFVAVAAGGAGCEELAAALRRGPLSIVPQFPYHPHVTVAHDLPDDLLDQASADLASFSCRFWVTEVAVHVREAGGWTPHETLRLAGRRTLSW